MMEDLDTKAALNRRKAEFAEQLAHVSILPCDLNGNAIPAEQLPKPVEKP